jgi:hypothetical protein
MRPAARDLNPRRSRTPSVLTVGGSFAASTWQTPRRQPDQLTAHSLRRCRAWHGTGCALDADERLRGAVADPPRNGSSIRRGEPARFAAGQQGGSSRCV